MTTKEKALIFVVVGLGGLFLLFVMRKLMERYHQKPLREFRLCTEEYNAWKEGKSYADTWYPEYDLLVEFIRETGFSPFQGDYHCQEARKFLIEQGWNPDHIQEVKE